MMLPRKSMQEGSGTLCYTASSVSVTGIVVLEQFGLRNRNPYTSMTVLLFMLLILLALAILVLELKYSKRQLDKTTNSYVHATRSKISKYCFFPFFLDTIYIILSFVNYSDIFIFTILYIRC